MGFFDFLGGSSPEKLIAKHGIRMRKKDATAEDRHASALWLAEDGSVEALVALLGRFEMTYEHHMKDVGEKDLVAELLLEQGDQGIEALILFLPRCKNFARPLSLLERLAGRDRAIVTLLELIGAEADRSELKPEKKRQLLIKLAEYADTRAEAIALPFLEDFDEGVRYAAAEVLIAQEETEAVRSCLLTALSNPEEESNRLRVRIAEVVHSRHWGLGEHAEKLVQRPPSGWNVQGGRLVQG